MPTLEEIKTYLGIDGSHLDSLLADIINTAKELIEKVLRYSLSEFGDEVPSTVKETAKIIVSTYYNNRETIKQNELESLVSIALSRYRKIEF